MILKNKALLIYDFLTSPTEKIYERAARFHLRTIVEILEGKTAFTPLHSVIFDIFPEVASAAGTKILQHAGLSEAIRAYPMAALRLLLTSYASLSAILEPIVMTNAEATYYLLKAARDGKFALANPSDAYMIVLLKDPFWALRWYGDTQDENILARCVKLGMNPTASPEAAYIHLYFNTDADPLDFVDILSANPFYAYLASRHFYDRGIEFKYLNLRGLTPRWAYHFITDGFLDNEEGLVESMLARPDWLVEYLVESERYKDVAYIGGLYEKSMAKTQGNLQTIYFKLWWERVQAYAKKNPPAAPKNSAPVVKSS